MRRAGRERLALVALFGALVGLAWWAGRDPRLTTLEDRLRPQAVVGSSFGSGDTLRLALQEMGLIHPIPHAFRPSPEPVALTRRAAEAPERRRHQRFYSLAPLRREQLASALGIDPDWLAGEATLAALLVDPDELEELFANPRQRGDDWERLGFLALVEGGELLFSSHVGVRLHGGSSRSMRELGSFRIYFRERHGLDRVPMELFAGRRGPPPDRLVIRFDGGVDRYGHWRQFTNPLALDLARELGLPAPYTRPVALFLNGELAGVKSLTEWLHLDYLRSRFGHDRFTLVRTKAGAHVQGLRTLGDRPAYEELRRWVRRAPRLELEEAAARVDLDNLARWFLLVTFCATGDAFQGPLVREEAPVGRWFWIPWDLDQSFGYPREPGDWQSDTIGSILRNGELRGTLLRRLLKEDPRFRRHLLTVAAEALNHRWTPAVLAERAEAYARYGEIYRLEAFDPEPLRRFLAHRPQAMRELLGRHLEAGPPRRLVLSGPPGTAATVDGHPVRLPWEGWYWDGMEVELAGPAGAGLSWRPAAPGATPEATHRHRVAG
ncbi:MAG TPA: CotH kinase family protein, partial [Thermoanaerobaculia bacterium]|nr:CotH kinase family protein [Thermoanaerobaculia bacterium]